MECEIDKKAVTGVTGSQKVGQREAIYKGTMVLLVGSGKFIGSERQKGSAKRTQRRWKGRPCMVIATSEGTFFASNKEKSAEQKVCIYFLIITLRCVPYFSCPRTRDQRNHLHQLVGLAQSIILVSGQRIIKAHTHTRVYTDILSQTQITD